MKLPTNLKLALNTYYAFQTTKPQIAGWKENCLKLIDAAATPSQISWTAIAGTFWFIRQGKEIEISGPQPLW